MEKKSEYFNVLVTDIGGTNARMRLTKIPLDKSKEAIQIDYKKLIPKNYDNLEHCCSEYLKDFIGTDNYPIIAVIAIPGPINNNKCEIITNLMHWGSSDGNIISEKLKLKKVYLLNDFVVCGYGVLSNLIKDKDYFVINEGKPDENSSIGILGPGTGLGHALGFKSEKSKYHEIFPSEGGHQLFCPQNQTEWDFRNYLAEKLKLDHISLERGLAGPAIPYMYNYFIDKHNMESKLVDKNNENYESLRWSLKPEEIIESSIKETCPISVKVKIMFVEIFANACSNIALYTLPYKGIYIVGSISNSLQEFIRYDKTFLNRFSLKGRLKDFMFNFPIYLVVDINIGLKGSQEFARRKIEELIEL